MKTMLKHAAVAAIVFAAAAGATAASAGAAGAKPNRGETILMPYSVGCWSDEGYGRRSSCDTN